MSAHPEFCSCFGCQFNRRIGRAEATGAVPPDGDWLIFFDSLDSRTRNVLTNECIVGFDELCAHSADDLLRCPNFGKVGIRRLEELLAEFGRKLRPRRLGELTAEDAVRFARLRKRAEERREARAAAWRKKYPFLGKAD
jgi:DNA-directed RNA polymerase alpha subunit